jgi:hypothetical protein
VQNLSRELQYDVVMIQRVLLFAPLLLGAVCLFASDAPATPNLLAVASRQIALLNDSDRPFLMDVDFTVTLNSPTQGHLRLRWEAKDRWWSRVSMGKFDQVKFQKGEWTYTLRNVDFTPKQISDLMNLLHVGNVYDKLVTRADKQHMEGGMRLDCMLAQNPSPMYKREHYEVCVDTATHDIVTETRKYDGYASDDVYRAQFSSFVDFGGHRYPRKLESFKNGQTILSASVTGLQESALDPRLLVPPAGAIERRECQDKKDPEVLDQPLPDFNSRNHGKHETDAQVTVLTDGSVSKVEIVGSAGTAEDIAVMEKLKQWKFKPAMCGTEPIVMDIYVSVTHDTPFIR